MFLPALLPFLSQRGDETAMGTADAIPAHPADPTGTIADHPPIDPAQQVGHWEDSTADETVVIDGALLIVRAHKSLDLVEVTVNLEAGVIVAIVAKDQLPQIMCALGELPLRLRTLTGH